MADVSIWGEAVPAWLAALATGGALLAAMRAGRTANYLYDREVARDLFREEEARSSQASKVAAWPVVMLEEIEVDRGRWESVEHWGVHVANRSDVPVYRVELELTLTSGISDAIHIGVLPPADLPIQRVFPGLALGHLDGPEDWENVDSDAEVALVMKFWDANGRSWLRERDGTLAGGFDASVQYNRWWHSLDASDESDEPANARQRRWWQLGR